MTQKLIGLPPIASPDARVLILGSFPSPISRAKQQYFANPQNDFWRIIETLFGISSGDNYESRCEQLKTLGIAVWDVFGKCRNVGAKDTEIRDAELNDFETFYKNHPHIKKVFLAGRRAEADYQAVTVGPSSRIYLPSTSSANRGEAREKKWKVVLEALKR